MEAATPMGYVIMPGCTGPNGETLALAAMADGSITVQDASEVTIDLLWSLIFDSLSGGFAMVSAASVESGAPSVLGLVQGGGNTSPLALRLISDGLTPQATFDVAPGGTALAVRTTESSSVNLNVAGNGPYPPGSPVIAYNGWNGGAPNEIWTFKQIGIDDYPWTYTLAPECASGLLLTANPENAGGQLTLQWPAGPDITASAAQLWAASYYINGTTPLGVVFINLELSMAMRTTPNGGAVFCVDPTDIDAWTTWRVGGAPDPGVLAVHTAGNDDLTLNASGTGPYDPGNVVITYAWQGGAQNEQWFLTNVPHEVT